VGIGTSVLVVSDVSKGPAMFFVGGVNPWSLVHGGRVVVASWAPRWFRAAIEAVVSGSSSCVAAVGVLVADEVGPKGVGCVPRVEGPALPLGDVAAGAASSGRLGASEGVVRVALGDVSLWDVIPMGSKGGGSDPGREVAIPLDDVAAGWSTSSHCGDLRDVFWGGLGPPEMRGDEGSGLGAAGREVVEVGPGGMVVPRYLGTGDGEGLGVANPASLGAAEHAQAGESGPEVVG
jgi:hypothetical protein